LSSDEEAVIKIASKYLIYTARVRDQDYCQVQLETTELSNKYPEMFLLFLNVGMLSPDMKLLV